MFRVPRAAIGVLGAAALVGALLTNALASQPGPSEARGHAQGWKYNYHGNALFNGIVRITKNNSVYGKLYAHGGEQVWRELLLNSGGLIISKGSLSVSSPSSQSSFGGSLSIAGNLSAAGISASALSTTGAISGASLSTTGAATIAGKLTASGGIDAGSANITTTGGITAGTLTAGTLTATNLNLSGAFQPANITTNTLATTGAATIGGTLSAGNVNLGGTLTFNNARVAGTVDFSGASVIGLSGLGGSVTSLTVGALSGTTAPLTIQGNGGTATIGVNSTGTLQIASLAATGNVTVAGTLTTPTISGPPTGASNTPGNLTLTGSSVTLGNGADLNLALPSTSGVASHIIANGNGDVAGQLAVSVPGGTTAGTDVSSSAVPFTQAYATKPSVIVTALGNPESASNNAPKVWVEILGSSGSYTGFKVHYAPSEATVGTTYSVTFDYLVIGQ